MSLRLKLVTFASRLFFKQTLARVQNLQRLCRYLDFITKINARDPKRVLYKTATLNYKAQTVSVLWSNMANPSQAHVLLYIHGGGFIFGSADTHKHLAADILAN